MRNEWIDKKKELIQAQKKFKSEKLQLIKDTVMKEVDQLLETITGAERLVIDETTQVESYQRKLISEF